MTKPQENIQEKHNPPPNRDLGGRVCKYITSLTRVYPTCLQIILSSNFILQAALFKFQISPPPTLQNCTLQLQSPRFLCQIIQFQITIIKGWLKYIYRIFQLPNTAEFSVVFEYSGFKRAGFFAPIMSFFCPLVSKTEYIIL